MAKSFTKQKIDPILKDMNKFLPEHKQLMMKHLKDVLVKINNDEMSIEELISNLKGTLVSLTNLKKSYTNE